MSILNRLKIGLQKTRFNFMGKVEQLFYRDAIDEEFYEELEELLISGDIGIKSTMEICDQLRQGAREKKIREPQELKEYLKKLLLESLNTGSSALATSTDGPTVILVLGVNGAGKTTTIGKLAHSYVQKGHKVLLAAGDTFRAAAIYQLEIWAARAGADLIKHQPGADPSAVFYDAINAARARGADIVLGDTAGRLQTKVNLMEELKKIHRVLQKSLPGAPHEVLLVIDATTGQNGISQAKLFHEAVPLTGLVLTKLDGTAKGGIIIAIKRELGLPVKLIGVGEGIEDLQPFEPQSFIEALFSLDKEQNTK
ncbi:MAG: signal recognition particle-docking protein FtsY [Dethiobacteria bacterium]|jgi:fused signal recognition particle receptor|nr:signal recognition particle-docking protein FtsY [Bacillota bacterium]